MKTINKIIFFFFSCFALINVINCFYYPNGRPNYTATGAFVGLAASGGKAKGLGAGLATGVALDLMTRPEYQPKQPIYYDDRYYDGYDDDGYYYDGDDYYYDDDGYTYYRREYPRYSKPSYRTQRSNQRLEKRDRNRRD